MGKPWNNHGLTQGRIREIEKSAESAESAKAKNKIKKENNSRILEIEKSRHLEL